MRATAAPAPARPDPTHRHARVQRPAGPAPLPPDRGGWHAAGQAGAWSELELGRLHGLQEGCGYHQDTGGGLVGNLKLQLARITNLFEGVKK